MKQVGRTALAVALVAMLSVAGAGTAAADTIVVGPGDSIQAAVDSAEPGDVILIQPGIYREHVTITTHDLTLQGSGASRAGTVLLPPSEGEGLCAEEFQTGICVFGEFDQDFNVTSFVEDVSIHDLMVVGFEFTGIVGFGTDGLTVADTLLRNHGEYGLFVLASTNGTYVHNVAEGNAHAGIYIGDSPDANDGVSGNLTRRNLFGIFVRDASFGQVANNESRGNCVGMFFLDTGAPGGLEGWTIQDNLASRNTKACPPFGPAPAFSGAGILMNGANGFLVRDNVVNDNVPTGPTAASGGIILASAAFAGGADPVDNDIVSNSAHDNEPADLVYDGSGSDNRFSANDCDTSIPDGLCA